jgi:O-antigen ligase
MKMKIEKIMFILLFILAFTLPLTESFKNMALILFILVGFYATYKKEITPKIDFLNIIMLLIPIMILLGSYYAIDTQNTIRGTSSIITMSILFMYIRELEWTRKKVKSLFISFFLGFSITLIWGYYDLFYHGKRYLELHSVGHVNHSSIYMLLIFIISLVYLTIEFKKLKYYNILFIAIVCLVSIVSIFITGSRATMYTSIGAITLFGIYGFFKIDKKILLFLSLIVFVILFLFFLNSDNYMLNKFQRGIFNNAPRVDLIIGFFNTWIDNNILFGIGINNSGLINLKEYYSDSMFESMSHAHNTYITYLVERGFIGLMLYMTFMGYVLTLLIKNILITQNHALVVTAILIWIANFIISFANTTFHHENAILILIILALALNNSNIKEKNE